MEEKESAANASMLESEWTISYPLRIHDRKAFIVLTPKIFALCASIYQANALVAKTAAVLPDPELMEKMLLIDEIQASFAIEGIHIPDKELVRALDNPLDSSIQYSSLVRQYLLFLEGSSVSLSSSKDIRAIYDAMLLDQIQKDNPENVPDGQIYRKGKVGLYSRGRLIHQGIFPEEQLIQTINQSLKAIQDNDASWLVNAAFFHFLIGYAHPFYDGNGRLNRCLSLLLLKKELEPMTILPFSQILKNRQYDYYYHFSRAERPESEGNLTEFAEYFLAALKTCAWNMAETLCEKKQLYERVMEEAGRMLPASDMKLFAVLAIHTIYSRFGITKEALARKAGCCQNTVLNVFRKHKSLVEEFRVGRFKHYRLNLSAFQTEGRD